LHLNHLLCAGPWGCSVQSTKPKQDASQMAASVLSFAGAAAAAIIQSCLLFLELRRASSLQYNKTYEHKFRALRWARTLTYVALCVCQVCCTCS
jgi:hypothetical protein